MGITPALIFCLDPSYLSERHRPFKVKEEEEEEEEEIPLR